MKTWAVGFALPFIKSRCSIPLFFKKEKPFRPTAPCALNADSPTSYPPLPPY